MNILALLEQKTRFGKHVSRLSNNKAPGTDGVANEIIKNLPDDLLAAIHELYILMYMTAITPQHFKESNTILLYKKDDPLLLENYRPICLANTVAKLWTSMLADCMAAYADHYDILSYSQEGFRSRRNTVRQLQLVQNILTHAKLTSQDLYVMFVDFSSAFNTIDHDKLLIIMKHLGFPDDCIHVIRDLYTNASTRILVAGGQTEPVKIEKGTLQGDSLSPLLFIIFMEPLLRWLQSGGRGYKFGDVNEHLKQVKPFTVGCNAYADDLAAATSNAKDLSCQAEKVSRFAAWGGLKANAKKSEVSAILHRTAKVRKPSALAPELVERTKNELSAVRLGGQPLPFLHPDKQPYRYLGVMLTLTLNWSDQVRTLLTNVEQKGARLSSSLCSPSQKLRYIQSSIRPYITYSFPLGIYSLQDIKRLDSKLIKFAKKAYDLGNAAPNNLILEERDKMGMGLDSLMLDYAQLNTAYLVRALNDPGPLGWSTQALLKLQHQSMAGMQTLHKDRPQPMLQKKAQDHHLLKRLSLIKEAGIELQAPSPEIAPFLNLQENNLVNVLWEAGYDPLCLGLKAEIPPAIYMPLFQLGVKEITQVIDVAPGSGKLIILAASALQKLYPKHKVKAEHKRALNGLALILSGKSHSSDPIRGTRSADLSLEQRTVADPRTVERIKSMLDSTDAAGPRSHLAQKSVKEFHLDKIPDYSLEDEARMINKRKGLVHDLTLHERQRTAVAAQSVVRDLIPSHKEIVDVLLKRDRSLDEQPKKKKQKAKAQGRQTGNKRRTASVPLEYTILQDIVRKVPARDSEQQYYQYLRENSVVAEVVVASYQDFNEIQSICFEETWRDDPSDPLQARLGVQWAPHPVRKKDLPAFEECGYKCARLEELPQNEKGEFD